MRTWWRMISKRIGRGEGWWLALKRYDSHGTGGNVSGDVHKLTVKGMSNEEIVFILL